MTEIEKRVLNELIQKLLKGLFWILFFLLFAAVGLAWLLITNFQNL